MVRAPFCGRAAAAVRGRTSGWRWTCRWGKHRPQAMVIEVFEIGQLPDDLPVALEHVVLELILVVEAEAHSHLLDAVQIGHKAGMDAGEFALGSVVDDGPVIDEHVIRSGDVTQVVDMPGQLDEVGVGHRRIEFQRLDAGILRPVDPLAGHPVGVVVKLLRSLLPAVDIPEIDLPLDFPVIERELVGSAGILLDAAGRPHLEHRGQIGLLVDEHVVALLLAGNQVREEHHLVQGQLAVSGGHLLAAFGEGQPPVCAELVFESRAVLGDDFQRLAIQHV